MTARRGRMPQRLGSPAVSYFVRIIRQLWLMRRGVEEARILRRRFVSLNQLTQQKTARLEHLAVQLREQREALSTALGELQSCKTCVRPRSTAWPGGHCCNGSTARLFTNDELVALRVAGTTAPNLSPPRLSLTMGCAFRTRSGCSLHPAHRPNLCVRYTCRELEAELAERGALAQIAVLQRLLRATFDEFCVELQLVHRRLEDREWSALEAKAR